MRYIILVATLLFSFPVVAQDSDPYGSPDPVGSSYNDSNAQWQQHEQEETQQRQLIAERDQAEAQVRQLENSYQVQSPGEQFINQYGDCYTCR